jgi:hypothetical protein
MITFGMESGDKLNLRTAMETWAAEHEQRRTYIHIEFCCSAAAGQITCHL